MERFNIEWHGQQYPAISFPKDLFGTGGRTMNTQSLIKYISANRSFDDAEMSAAWKRMDRWRCPLQTADATIYDNILDLMQEWRSDNDRDFDDVFEEVDIEDIFIQLNYERE